MTILESWQRSLDFFKCNNLKTYLSSIWILMPAVYRKWFSYSIWIPLFIVAALPQFFLYVLHGDLKRAHALVNISSINNENGYLIITIGMVLIISVLLSYTAMRLYIIVKQTIERNPQKVFSCMQHGLWGGAGLAVVSVIILWRIYLPIQHAVHMDYATKMAYLTDYLRMGPSRLPSQSIEEFTTISADKYMLYKSLFTSALVTTYSWVVLGMLFIMLFFLQNNATLSGFSKSIRNAFLFIVYNLPGLLIMTIALLCTTWLLGLLVCIPFEAFGATVMARFIAIGMPIIVIAALPIVVTLFAYYFYSQLGKQPKLYIQ